MEISVVIPSYNSENSILILIEQLKNVLNCLDLDYEIIVVDDCSHDTTWDRIKNLKIDRPYLKIVKLARNFGQNNALLCGFSLAKGNIILTMDDDLQHRPTDIPRLLSAINQDYDLVIGSYGIKRHAAWRNLGGKLIDAYLRIIHKVPKYIDLTSFRAFRRNILKEVDIQHECFPYVTTLLIRCAKNYKNVNVNHAQREFGISNYSPTRSFVIALKIFFSNKFVCRLIAIFKWQIEGQRNRLDLVNSRHYVIDEMHV